VSDDAGSGDPAGESGPGPTIEPATMDDLDAVVDGWLALAADQRRHGSHVLVDPNRETVTETVGGHVLAGEVLVARPPDGADSGEALVGFVVVRMEGDAYERDAARGDVPALWVAPGHRGDGVGAALLSAAEQLLAERGAEAVRLEVLAANDGARRFYARAGYEEHRHVLEKPLDGADEGTAGVVGADGRGGTDDGDDEKR
jgi:ribosomal protein S18 acetylase RimI-like enzyme